MKNQESWSKDWRNSRDQSKQRKYRLNAPRHIRKKFLCAPLLPHLQEKTGSKNATIREGDRVEVMRGDLKGLEGEVTRIDYDQYRVYVDGVERSAADGSTTKIPLQPSNLRITKIDLSDTKRLKNVDDTTREELTPEESADEEPDVEEASEETSESADTEVEEESRVEDTSDSAPVPPEDIVSSTVSDAKKLLKDFNGDLEAVLEAEKQGKNRVTLVEHIEQLIEGESQ